MILPFSEAIKNIVTLKRVKKSTSHQVDKYSSYEIINIAAKSYRLKL
jgi:hypothetical protein